MHYSINFYLKIAALFTLLNSILVFGASAQCSINAGFNFRACHGEVITFTPIVTDGVEPFSFTYDNGTDSGTGLTTTASGIPNANQNQDYTITVTDADGCISSDAVRVNVRSLADASVTVTDVTCSSAGSLEFSFPDHPSRLSIEFSVDGEASYFSQVDDNIGSVSYSLSAGTYHCFARWGSNQCPQDIGTYSIQDFGAMALEVGDPEIVCNGDEITLNPMLEGGIPPINYTWTDGFTSGTGLTFIPEGSDTSNLEKTYTITATDILGCIATDDKVFQMKGLPIITDISIIDGCGTNCGVIFAFEDFIGRPTLEFSLDGGASYESPISDTLGTQFYNIPPDDYSFFCRWGNDQCPIDLGSFTINPTIFLIDAGADYIICDGDEVTLSPDISGGVEPFSFTFSNGEHNGTGLTFKPQGDPNQNMDNTYMILVTDANGCEARDEVDITVRSTPSVMATGRLTACDGSGSITFEFPDHPDNMGIQFSLDGETTYENPIFDNVGSISYDLPNGSYDTYARFFGNICPTPIKLITLINASSFSAVENGFSSDPIWVPLGGSTPLAIEFCEERDLVINPSITVIADKDIIGKSITILSQARLDMSSDSHNINLYGDLTLAGIGRFIPRESTVSFMGDLPQSINGSSVELHTVEINNLAGVQLNSDVEVSGSFKCEQGIFDVNGNNFVLTSELVGGNVLTGSIAEIKNGADFLGDIKMQRCVESIEDGYRLIGVPILNQTVGDFQGDFITTGFPGSDYPDHYFTNIKYYDETKHHITSVDSGFVDVSDVTNLIDSDKGYWAYFPPSTSVRTLESEGEFNKGDITFELSYSETGPDAFEGWNCIPNPYPSAIDIMSLDIELVNADRAIYILDHTKGGNWRGEYVIYNNGVSINGGSSIVASYQAFFIKATGPGASITFREPCKTNEQGVFYRNIAEERSLFRFSINQEDEKYETVLAFHEDATNNYDSNFDAYKKNSVMFSVGTVVGEDVLSINTLESYYDAIEVPVFVYAPQAGNYELQLDDLQNIETDLCLTIQDLVTNEVLPFEVGLSIPFSIEEGGFEGERFLISSKPGARLRTEAPSCGLSEDGLIELNPLIGGSFSYTVMTDELEVLASDYSNGNTIIEGLNGGNYLITIISEEEQCGTMEFNAHVPETPVLPGSSVSYIKDHCNLEEGKIFISANHESELTAQLFKNGEFIEEVSGFELLIFEELEGAIYEVHVSNGCEQDSHTVSIINQNLVDPLFVLPSEGTLLDGSLTLTLESESQNSLYDEWFVNGEQICESSTCFLAIDSPGLFEITLRSTGTHCAKEITKSILVTRYSVDDVEELEDDFTMTVTSIGIDINRTRGEKQFDTVEIFDVNGKLVARENTNVDDRAVINHSDLANGAYIIRLSLAGELVYSQIVSK